MPTEKISNRSIANVKAGEKDQYLWDQEMSGFGLKVTPAGTKVFLVQYRIGGRSGKTRRVTIGGVGTPFQVDEFNSSQNEVIRTVSLTPEIARREAKRILGMVAVGKDPAEDKSKLSEGISVSQLCEIYLAEGVATKKASTIKNDKGRIQRHVKPLLGRRKVREVNKEHIEKFMIDVANGKTASDEKIGWKARSIVKGGKGSASRTVGMLGGIFAFAVDRGYCEENPVRGVKRYRDNQLERYMTFEELARLGEALENAERNGSEHPSAINTIRLLLFTGCRKNEVLSLKWEYVDFENEMLRLPDSKTGQKVVLLGDAALDLLKSLPKFEGNPYAFPGIKPGNHFVGLGRVWRRLAEKASVNDVRLHDIRHTFASEGASLGLGLPIVGNLLGHKNPSSTARYAHVAPSPARKAANNVSGALKTALNSHQSIDSQDSR